MTQIKNHKEYYISRNGEVYSMINNAGNKRKKPYKLKQTLDRNGYYWVGLKGSNKAMEKVHRLVAKAFIPNPENKPVVNHIDGNKTNNNVENLEWCTYSENTKHAHNTGLCNVLKGENASNAKLTNEECKELIQYTLDGYTNDELSKIYGLHSRYISLIRHKKRWKTIWDTYFKGVDSIKSEALNKQRDADTLKSIVDEAFTTKNSNAAIGRKYNVDPSTISRIRHNDKKVQKYFLPYMEKYLNN